MNNLQSGCSMQMNLDKTLLKFEEKLNINRNFFLHSAMFTKFWIVVSCIPDSCHFLHNRNFWPRNFTLERKFATKVATPQNSVQNFTLCVKFYTVCKILHCLYFRAG